MISGILQEMTIDAVRAFAPEVVLLGVGSTEPHGPALPYGTDFFHCDAVCRAATARANAAGARVLMYPTLPIGNNVNFKGFPFACRIGVRTLMQVLLDIVQALEEDGIRKIVISSGHGGNDDAIKAMLREHFDRTTPERRAFVCLVHGLLTESAARAVEVPSPHGGESEVSAMLHLHPDLVPPGQLRDQLIIPATPDCPSLSRAYFIRPWHRLVPLSGGGDTRKATREKGRTLVEGGAEALANLLVELSKCPWNRDFPFREES